MNREDKLKKKEKEDTFSRSITNDKKTLNTQKKRGRKPKDYNNDIYKQSTSGISLKTQDIFDENVSDDFETDPNDDKDIDIDLSTFKTWNPDQLPDNFACLIVSKRRAGKTHLLQHMLEPIKDRFNAVFLFSPTAYLQKKVDEDPFFFVPKSNIFESFSEQTINALMFKNEKLKLLDNQLEPSKRMNNKILIILDDVINDPEVTKSITLKNIFSKGRHSNCSCIALAQKLSSRGGFDTVIRDNVDCFITFSIFSDRVRDMVSECYASIVNKKEGKKLLNKITTSEEFMSAVLMIHTQNIKKYQDYIFLYKAPKDPPKEYIIGDNKKKNGFFPNNFNHSRTNDINSEMINMKKNKYIPFSLLDNGPKFRVLKDNF